MGLKWTGGPGCQEQKDPSNNSVTPEGLTVGYIMQWTGQRHKPVLPSEKKDFVIHMKFHHDCDTQHTVCFSTGSSCDPKSTAGLGRVHLQSVKDGCPSLLQRCEGRDTDAEGRYSGHKTDEQHLPEATGHLPRGCEELNSKVPSTRFSPAS